MEIDEDITIYLLICEFGGMGVDRKCIFKHCVSFSPLRISYFVQVATIVARHKLKQLILDHMRYS